MSSFQAAHRVRLREPELEQHDVVFRWQVTPETELYRRSCFRLSFPSHLDLSAVPRSLWWRVALICLHSHWALLRPCQVVLPIRLGAAEREFWLRLIHNVTVQLEAYGNTPRPGPAVELVEAGEPLVPVVLAGNHDRAVVAFSGGKDSLVLSGLLAELTDRPLLVTTSSPVPWARDHVGAARARARTEIVKRLPVEAIEVRSDFRTCWDLGFSARDGCTLGVHELSDLPLYQGAMVAVAAASGIPRMFMASEADIQYNLGRDREVILHREFMSCAVTQAALDALLSRFGLRQGSLTYPLHMSQVQALLLRRYLRLADLQFSCWQAPEGEQACSACGKCLQIALVTLREGHSPRGVGIDPVRVLTTFGDLRLESLLQRDGPALHALRSPAHHILGSLQEVTTERVASMLADDELVRTDRRLGEALAVYARLRADALSLSIPPAPGYIAGFLEMVHADLRGPLRAILDQHFSPAPSREFREIVGRSTALARWIAEPLERDP